MDSLKRLVVLTSLLVGSAIAALLFISGVGFNMSPVAWMLYFPFYGTLYISSLVWQFTGLRVMSPLLFLIGVILTTVYFFILMEKAPKVAYVGGGVLFFIFLLICGRAVFVRFIYLPQSTTLEAAVYSVKVFVEFLVALALLYLVLDEVPHFPILHRNTQE